eukprot:gnl/TRDRNA2_/TRDRNA2_146975_c0_seq1.p1 gnl/TRDRNA2_/TRDRNA2_146975_c0~~gnl/TRDRNA2_/TRDRNA2_146975_c0_seq1.p1  ORF type:complete len:1044 (+),score=134.06 gnl/TRDRNA2_/TRDRNA2_146975_c0_seq1:103-3234(+)
MRTELPRPFMGPSDVFVERSASLGGAAGGRIRISADCSDTVRSLQERVLARWNVAPCRQLLSFVDCKSLEVVHLEPEERNIRTGATIRQRCFGEFRIASGSSLLLTDFTELRTLDLSCCRIDQVESRGMTVRQLEQLLAFARKNCWQEDNGTVIGWVDGDRQSLTFGQSLSPETLNFYQAVDWVLRPACYESRCSFVELISRSAEKQKPAWYVSHSFIDPITQLVSCLKEHVQLRGFQDKTPYWIAAFSLDQSAVDFGPSSVSVGEGAGAHQMPFCFRVLRCCDGFVLFLGENGRAISRSWCCMEVSLALEADLSRRRTSKSSLLFDVAAIDDGAVVLIDSRSPAKFDDRHHNGLEWLCKAKREIKFPLSIIRRCLSADLRGTQASKDQDWRWILNFVASGGDGRECDKDPPAEHEEYARMNRKLRAAAAAPGLLHAVKNGDSILVAQLGEALRADETRTSVHLNFAGCDSELNDDRLAEVVAALHPGLSEVGLVAYGCRSLTDKCMQRLAQVLPRRLTTLHLGFFMCGKIGDTGARHLAKVLPSTLTTLRLDMAWWGCGDEGVADLAKALPNSLKVLELSLNATAVTDKGIKRLAQERPKWLHRLDLSLQNTKVSNDGIKDIAMSLPPCLGSLRLDLYKTKVTDDILARTKSIKAMRSWQKEVSPEAYKQHAQAAAAHAERVEREKLAAERAQRRPSSAVVGSSKSRPSSAVSAVHKDDYLHFSQGRGGSRPGSAVVHGTASRRWSSVPSPYTAMLGKLMQDSDVPLVPREHGGDGRRHSVWGIRGVPGSRPPTAPRSGYPDRGPAMPSCADQDAGGDKDHATGVSEPPLDGRSDIFEPVAGAAGPASALEHRGHRTVPPVLPGDLAHRGHRAAAPGPAIDLDNIGDVLHCGALGAISRSFCEDDAADESPHDGYALSRSRHTIAPSTGAVASFSVSEECKPAPAEFTSEQQGRKLSRNGSKTASLGAIPQLQRDTRKAGGDAREGRASSVPHRSRAGKRIVPSHLDCGSGGVSGVSTPAATPKSVVDYPVARGRSTGLLRS